MKKTMNFWVFIFLLTVMVAAFFVLKARIDPANEALKQKIEAIDTQQQDLQILEAELQEAYNICETDSYIEKIAREKYNYMSENEYRIVIVNPEDIYENGIVPDRSLKE